NMNFKYPEKPLENIIELHGDGRNNGTLTIKNLQLDDSTVYFCAVRLDTVLQNSVIYDKNLLVRSSTNLPPAAGFQTTCSINTIKALGFKPQHCKNATAEHLSKALYSLL
ncbi:MAG: hypothetical protein ACRCVL_08130, partial [Cetobacterium sp.]